MDKRIYTEEIRQKFIELHTHEKLSHSSGARGYLIERSEFDLSHFLCP